MRKILHIVNDEKFIVDTDDLLNKIPGFQHRYAVIGKKKKLKNLNDLDVIFIHPINVVLGFNLNFFMDYDGIIFHGLKGFKFNLLNKIKKGTPISWIGWGYDYYRIVDSDRSDFLQLLTKKAVNSLPKRKKRLTKVFLRYFEPSIKTKLKALRRVMFFNTVVKEDHYILKKAIGNSIPKYFDWNYPIIKKSLLNIYISNGFSENNILIGNSNSVTNNHLDAFNLIISSASFDYNEIVCPLSYGGTEEYKNLVIREGEKKFQKKFRPLTEFYKPKEYFDILNSCTYYFSPTIRQQAFGNILLMLYSGASVILYKDNPVFRSLLEKNIIIFSELDIQRNTVRKLTLKEIEINRKIVMENFSEEILVNKTEKFLNAFLK